MSYGFNIVRSNSGRTGTLGFRRVHDARDSGQPHGGTIRVAPGPRRGPSREVRALPRATRVQVSIAASRHVSVKCRVQSRIEHSHVRRVAIERTTGAPTAAYALAAAKDTAPASPAAAADPAPPQEPSSDSDSD